MGLDLIELDFRIEKRFGVRIGIEEWERAALGRVPFDLTAAEVTGVVDEALRRAGMSPAVPRPAREAASRRVLDYAVSEHVVAPVDDVWAEVRNVIAATGSVPAVRVVPSSWLRGDLGMEF